MNETHPHQESSSENDQACCVIKHGDHPDHVIEVLKARLDCGNCKVVVAEGWCKKCGLCMSFCPVKALDRNSEGFPVVNNEKCISCGTCEIFCPDFAIIVRNLKDKTART